VNNAPQNSPVADRFNQFLVLLLQLIVAQAAQAGVKLPAALVAMMEAQLRSIGQDFARLAASVEKGQLPSRRERRTRGKAARRHQKAQKFPLPRREGGRPARKPDPESPLNQAIQTGFRATDGPKIRATQAHPLARP
jgi:hypothetical protein